jgi:hypothetical protein
MSEIEASKWLLEADPDEKAIDGNDPVQTRMLRSRQRQSRIFECTWSKAVVIVLFLLNNLLWFATVRLLLRVDLERDVVQKETHLTYCRDRPLRMISV